MQSEWLCEYLHRSHDDRENIGSIDYAEVKDLIEKKRYHIHAKVFVLAAGAILTPQILNNSEISSRAIGHYLCEQPMAFCQIVLNQKLVDSIERRREWKEKVTQHKVKNLQDPIPIPFDDPTPQV